MSTKKVTFITFNEVSDRIAKGLMSTEPRLTAKVAAAMGHDLARAILRIRYGGGEVPTHLEISQDVITNMANICREGLLSA